MPAAPVVNAAILRGFPKMRTLMIAAALAVGMSTAAQAAGKSCPAFNLPVKKSVEGPAYVKDGDTVVVAGRRRSPWGWRRGTPNQHQATSAKAESCGGSNRCAWATAPLVRGRSLPAAPRRSPSANASEPTSSSCTESCLSSSARWSENPGFGGRSGACPHKLRLSGDCSLISALPPKADK
jgi:hypothetical protein